MTRFAYWAAACSSCASIAELASTASDLESGIPGEKFGSEAAIAIAENEGLAGMKQDRGEGRNGSAGEQGPKLNHSNQR